MIVVSNNPKVWAYYAPDQIKEVHGDYYDVLIAVRDLIHTHYKLLTHPLSGSIKPNETPYKSIAVEKSEAMDFDGLSLIEKAIETFHKLQNDFKTPNWTDRVRADFMVIDYDLIKHAIKK